MNISLVSASQVVISSVVDVIYDGILVTDECIYTCAIGGYEFVDGMAV